MSGGVGGAEPRGSPLSRSAWFAYRMRRPTERRLYFPAAFRRASLIRSCQPGPPSRKYSSTSWSIRSETSSFTPGTAVFLGGASTTFVVVRLNAASASVRASLKVLGRLGWSDIFQIPSNSAVDKYRSENDG